MHFLTTRHKQNEAGMQCKILIEAPFRPIYNHHPYLGSVELEGSLWIIESFQF